jgi:hypothetical protein
MLEDSSQIAIEEVVFRIANPPRFRAALADLNASLEDVIETIDFLGAANEQDSGLMLTVPFQEDPTGNFKPSPTRYSDGTWRVFLQRPGGGDSRRRKKLLVPKRDGARTVCDAALPIQRVAMSPEHIGI